ncbi:long-chain fatty acid--CoA ligase [Candidatus Falkowbacteria bacterium]|nr:long-chain fatty acid--CoA ligase [Candidatus Falkowbacteria bacterium]
MVTLPQKFFQISTKHPKKDFLVAKKDGKWRSIAFKQAGNFIKFFACGLREIGLAKGDRVAILSANRPVWPIVDLGIMSAGGISVPIHTTLSQAKIEYILKDSESRFLFVAGQENFDKILSIKNKTKTLLKTVYLDAFLSEVGEAESFDQLLNLGYESKAELDIDKHVSKEIASIVYTSGTTGEPKGVMLSHENFLTNAISAIRAVSIKSSDTFLSFLPLSHVLERTAGYYVPMSVGATINYAENVKKLADNLKEVKPTVLVCVPRIFEKVYEKIIDKTKHEKGLKKKLFFSALKTQSEIHHARREGRSISPVLKIKAKALDKLVCSKVRQALGGHLRFAVSGGSSLNKKIARFFEDLGINIIEGYGLTETSPIITVNHLDKYEFGTVGLPLKEVQLKISADKEILVRGPNVMSGYWKNPQATAEVLTPEGWFSTGDLGFLDEYGFLSIIGRKKEIIITSGGKNVSPEPVENALQLSKYISQAMIIGNNRRFVSALIVPDFEKLKDFIKEKKLDKFELVKNNVLINLIEHEVSQQLKDLPEFEKVKKFVLLDCEFTQEAEELTPTFKLRRAIIESKHKKGIEAMYAEDS